MSNTRLFFKWPVPVQLDYAPVGLTLMQQGRFAQEVICMYLAATLQLPITQQRRHKWTYQALVLS